MSSSTVKVPRKTARDGEQTQLASAVNVGEQIQSCKLTLTGASVAFKFSSKGLKDMKDKAYRVFIHGEFVQTTATPSVDESTITTQGFTIIGGANNEVAHIMVHGLVAGES